MTTTSYAVPATRAQSSASVPTARLIGVHTKAQLLDLFRTPVAIVSTTIFPTLAFLFFVLPQQEVVNNPLWSLVTVAQLAVFGVMSAYLFGYGIGIAEERANPWTSYLRTLPIGALPTTISRFLVAAFAALLSLVPLVLAVALLTSAPDAFTSGDLAWWRLPAALGAVILVGAPFLAMGLFIGYLLSAKAAIAVAQVVNFPLAFIGGLMLPPEMFPGWVDAISLGTPSRAARDAVVAVLTGEAAPASTWVVLIGWTVAMTALAVWANRRDEGRRFR